jgi:hypothetical protein
LEKIQNESQDDEAVAYFYCDRNDDPLRIPANILLSLIKQLSIRTSQDTVHYLLVQAYNEKEKEGFLSNTLSVAECSSLLSQLIETFPRTTLIVDALDECDLRLRRDFMKVLEQLVGSCLNLKILVSSRRDQDIQLQLEKRANIGISATDNGKDVATYLAQSFLEDERSDFIPRELQEEIIQTLLVRSEGM